MGRKRRINHATIKGQSNKGKTLLNILKNAKAQCEYLIVGVSTDEVALSYKHKRPVIPYDERREIVSAIKYVDKVVPQVSMNKIEAYQKYISIIKK